MTLISIPAVTSLLLLLSSLSRAAPRDVTKSESGEIGSVDDVNRDSETGLAKRVSSFVRIGRPSSFVRIGRPSSFVRIGRGSHFVRIGRPGNFVRIGRGYEGDLGDLGYSQSNGGADKRASSFVRIGKASRFVRIGKSGEQMSPQDKRMPSFVRIGRGTQYSDLYSDNPNKRLSSFVRIGRSPAFADLQSGPTDSAADGGESDITW